MCRKLRPRERKPPAQVTEQQGPGTPSRDASIAGLRVPESKSSLARSQTQARAPPEPCGVGDLLPATAGLPRVQACLPAPNLPIVDTGGGGRAGRGSWASWAVDTSREVHGDRKEAALLESGATIVSPGGGGAEMAPGLRRQAGPTPRLSPAP